MSNNASLSGYLADFLAKGKIDVDIEIREGYVIGVCGLYPERSAGEGEYMLREKSVVAFDKERGLGACAQEAKDAAYASAVSRLQAKNVIRFPLEDTVTQPAHRATATSGQNDDSEADTDSNAAPASQGNVGQTETGDSDIDNEKARRVEPESLIPAKPPEQDELDALDEDEPEGEGDEQNEGMPYKKALATSITVCGKAHSMYNRTAGEILTKEPELIVYLATRGIGANGAKANEYAAIKTLYNEAIELADKKAA